MKATYLTEGNEKLGKQEKVFAQTRFKFRKKGIMQILPNLIYAIISTL